MHILRTVFLSLLGFCFVLSFSVVFVLFFRPLYYYDMKAQNLSVSSGMSEQEIKENYDALINYNSLFYQDELSFPTLPMSESGRIHFEEVKAIFSVIQLLFLFSSLIFFPLAGYTLRVKKERAFLLGIPLLSGLLGLFSLFGALIDWDGFFTMFHHLMFRNNYWLFNPQTDPIINLLPDSFFFHCLAAILLIMTLLLLVCVLFYAHVRRRAYKGKQPAEHR